MPTVNFFYRDDSHRSQLSELGQDIKACVAVELTCGDIQLDPSGVSIHLIHSEGSGMIAEIEVEV